MTDGLNNGLAMPRSKIGISIDAKRLERLDACVRVQVHKSRTQTIQFAPEEKLGRVQRSRLARECAKLNPKVERRLAEEDLAEDAASWPAYLEARSAGPTSSRPAAEQMKEVVEGLDEIVA